MMDRMKVPAPPRSLDRLEFAFKRWSYHHSAIWEAQKHFTWFISIVLSAQVLSLTTKSLSHTTRLVAVEVLSVVGLVLAWIGCRVQRREGSLFTYASDEYVAEHNAVFPKWKMPVREVKDEDASKMPGNPSWPALLVAPFRPGTGIRVMFQWLFLLFMVGFVAVGAVAPFIT